MSTVRVRIPPRTMKYMNGIRLNDRVVDRIEPREYKSKNPGKMIGLNEDTPYSRKLQAMILKREQEVEDAKNKRIKPDNHLLYEMLDIIKVFGLRSEARLSLDLGQPQYIIHNVGLVLRRAKVLQLTSNRRGLISYKLHARVAQR